MSSFYKSAVIGDYSGELWEMPWIPLFDSHRESIDIFIKEFDQTDGLDDRLIISVDI